MWIITDFGFFSVVQKPGDKAKGSLTIRARVQGDLETLRDRYLPSMGKVSVGAGTDYRYRATAPREAVAVAFLRALMDLDYGNFKSAVAKAQGHERAQYYHQMWDIHYAMQEHEAPLPKTKSEPPPETEEKTSVGTTPAKPKTSYGGVLLDGEFRVLLREPTNHFDGYVWTFPKGRPQKGDTAEQCALREVQEETGYEAIVLGKIAGSFAGGTGKNEYFLMQPVGDPAQFDAAETQSIRWASCEEAKSLIKQTTNAVGRKRDLDVLKAAMNTPRPTYPPEYDNDR